MFPVTASGDAGLFQSYIPDFADGFWQTKTLEVMKREAMA